MKLPQTNLDSSEEWGDDVDVVGALDRFQNDKNLLAGMLDRTGTALAEEMKNAGPQLRSGDFQGALHRIHRLRGDLLNLGLHKVADQIQQVEIELSSLCEKSTAPKSTLWALHMEAELVEIGGAAIKTINRVLAFLRKQGDSAHAEQLVRREDENARGAYEDLLAALNYSETRALNHRVLEQKRILPDRYSWPSEIRFRRLVERLEFQEAISILDVDDRHAAESALVKDREGIRILIIDDSEVTIKTLAKYLGEVGYVRFAKSSALARSLVTNWAPDVVLCDVHLEGESGIEFCRWLKSERTTKSSAVIMISADTTPGTEIAALTAGAVDFIEKPINATRLIARVRSQLKAVGDVTQNFVKNHSSTNTIGYLTASLSGTVTDLSPNLMQIAPNNLSQGFSLCDFFAEESRPMIELALANCWQSGHFPRLETRLRNAGVNEISPVSVYGWSAASAENRLLWLTVESQSEALMREYSRSNESASKAIDTITSGIAHEFNNLLNIAIGNLDLLGETALEETQRRCINDAATSLIRAAEISRRLGGFSLQVSHGECSTEERSLDELLDYIWPILENALPKNVRLKREAAEERVVSAKLVPMFLRDALLELIENAKQAMPEGGEITIRTTKVDPNDASFVALEVSDTGTGMQEDVLARVFDPFFTTQLPLKTGLGLTQLRNNIRRIDGKISIQSEWGKGTTVKLFFKKLT